MPTVANGDTHAHNGAPFLPSAHVQADFYAKLTRLESQVLTGRHPRYKLSRQEVEKLASALAQTPVSRASRNTGAVVANGLRSPFFSQVPATLPAQPVPASIPLPPRPPIVQSLASVKQKPVHARPAISQIDPVLLIKSDDLVRAETRLKRQRIERSLKDSVDAKKVSFRDKEVGVFSGPHNFDSTQVLETALTFVKPVSGLQPDTVDDTNSSSSSFGDGYYSSKANSWSPVEMQPANVADIVQPQINTTGANASFSHPQLSEHRTAALQRGRIGGLGPRFSPAAYKDANETLQSGAQYADVSDLSGNLPTTPMDTENSREESYSPPAADAFNSVPGSQVNLPSMDVATSNLMSHKGVARSTKRISDDDRVRESESYSPPPADFPVIQNQIFVSNAPQPEQTSPFASGQPGQTQHGGSRSLTVREVKAQARHARAETRRKRRLAKEANKGAPASHSNQATSTLSMTLRSSRKRRRDDDHGPVAPPQHVQNWITQPLRSPEPHIKVEPISPPLQANGHASEPPRRLVLRNDGRADIEVLSPRVAVDARPLSRGHRHRETTSRLSQVDARYVDPDPIWIDSPDGPPPVARPRVERDSTDLRRVASLHHHSRAQSPTRQPPPYPADEVRYVPGPLRVIQRPNSRQSDLFEDPVEQTRHHYAAPRLYASATSLYNEYIPTPLPVRQVMPPPPPSKRRIFVDEYGNEFIAIPTRSLERRSVAPEPQYEEGRLPYQRDTYREPVRAQSHALERAPPIRAQSHLLDRQPIPQPRPHIIELDDDEPDYQRMPPPPQRLLVRKRGADALDDQMQYRDHPSLRAASLQPLPPARADLQQRYVSAADWADDRTIPEVRQRAYSIRPHIGQYEPGSERMADVEHVGDRQWRRH